MQVKELEESCFQSCLLDLGSAELCWHFPLGSWKLGLVLFGSSQTLPFLLFSTASYLQSLLAADCMQLLLKPFSPIAGELLSIPAHSFISQCCWAGGCHQRGWQCCCLPMLRGTICDAQRCRGTPGALRGVQINLSHLCLSPAFPCYSSLNSGLLSTNHIWEAKRRASPWDQAGIKMCLKCWGLVVVFRPSRASRVWESWALCSNS